MTNLSAENFTKKYTLLYEASLVTAKKYGRDQLEGALKRALKGNFDCFTNDMKYREQLIESLNPGDVERICIMYVSDLGYKDIPNDYLKIFANDIYNKILFEQSVYA